MRIVEDFYYHAKYYERFPSTCADFARRMGATPQGLKSLLFYARLPGVSIELTPVRRKKQCRVVYLIFVEEATALKEHCRRYFNG